MQLIKLDATASTNGYLKSLVKEKQLEDFTVVICEHQTQGRGQKGNQWVSEKGKNLTISILKKINSLEAHQSFGLNCLVSLAVHDVLNELLIPKVKVKWPNDIMSGNKKLCGILIENSISGSQIKQSIIGIGLNVNQVNFSGFPNATSLRLRSGKDYDLENVLNKILKRLKLYFEVVLPRGFEGLKNQYDRGLFRKDEWSKFSVPTDNSILTGMIKGITTSGQLIIEVADREVRAFNFKEIQMIY
ncbi:MAG: biotin--[acetyl-CoA-carboxylase] ligase [Bacteroidota bacterium]